MAEDIQLLKYTQSLVPVQATAYAGAEQTVVNRLHQSLQDHQAVIAEKQIKVSEVVSSFKFILSNHYLTCEQTIRKLPRLTRIKIKYSCK